MLPRSPFRLRNLAFACLIGAALSGCSDDSNRPVVVSVIGGQADLDKPLAHLPDAGAKLMLEATAQGLVAFDAAGDILPALAQRWIVEDDGRSYIFRLRRATWPGGARVTAREVARLLQRRIETLRDIDPDGVLDAVEEVVPMTGEVLEIRLSAPRPTLLQMLAQPQMAILSSEGGTGPYRARANGEALVLTPVPDPADADSEDDAPPSPAERRILRAERGALAIVRFREGHAALVLGGRFSDLPLLVQAKIDNNAVRVDPVQGLLGLAVTGKGALLDDDRVREAINMAIERDRLPGLFALGGWATSDQIVPQQLDLPGPPARPRWSGLSLDQRRAEGQAAVTVWRAAHGDPPALRIALPKGSGATLLYNLIAADLGAIGLPVRRVTLDDNADLTLIDEVAAYDSALWYLGRVGCSRKIHCSNEADARLHAVGFASTVEERAARLAEAEALVLAHNGYIPLGAPIRWSLVGRRLDGFAPSARARHPLNLLFRNTN